MIPMNIKFLGPDEYFFDSEDLCDAAGITLAVTPYGLKSGRPAVLIKIESFDATGQTIVIPTTARLLVTMAKMIEARYPDLMKD